MKKLLLITATLTTIGTSTVFANSDISKFFTINGVPVASDILSSSLCGNFSSIVNNGENCGTSGNLNGNSNSSNSNNNGNNSNNNNNNNNNSNSNSNNSSGNHSILSIEQQVLDLVNSARAKEGLNPLQLDIEVSNVARKKSEDMHSKNYFSHTSPTYGTPFDMLKQFGITYKSAGENIARGQRTAEAVVNAWLNSEGHRRNILSPNFTHIGIGFHNNYWTQLFISK